MYIKLAIVLLAMAAVALVQSHKSCTTDADCEWCSKKDPSECKPGNCTENKCVEKWHHHHNNTSDRHARAAHHTHEPRQPRNAEETAEEETEMTSDEKAALKAKHEAAMAKWATMTADEKEAAKAKFSSKHHHHRRSTTPSA